MPPSMRKLAILEAKRQKKNAAAARSRAEAVRLIAVEKVCVRIAAAQTGVSISLCYQIKTLADQNDNDKLSRLMDPNSHRRGRRPHLTTEQQQMIVERLLFAARRGFAADVEDLMLVMARVARLNGRPYKSGVPSDDTVRLFRATHRQLAYRNFEPKDLAKLKGGKL